jgi:hypothetical protein
MIDYKGNIFLDDERHPWDVTWGDIDYTKKNWWIVRDYEAFIDAVRTYWPNCVSLDNDLGEEKEGYDCLKWLIEYGIDNDFLLPELYFHSKNTVAVENMKSYVNSFKKMNG